MNVAFQIEFKADRKEPLGNLVRRVAAQFQQSGLQPEIVATFGDTPAGLRPTSAVERAIRKYPHCRDRTHQPLILKYQRGMKALIERIDLPYDVPPAIEALQANRGGSGPLKRTLVEACRSVTFHVSRTRAGLRCDAHAAGHQAR